MPQIFIDIDRFSNRKLSELSKITRFCLLPVKYFLTEIDDFIIRKFLARFFTWPNSGVFHVKIHWLSLIFFHDSGTLYRNW